MNAKRFAATIAALLTVLLVAPAQSSTDATVGEFLVRVAKARNLAATDARVAFDSLRAVGVRLPATLTLSDRLTEGEVTRLARTFGIRVTSSQPDAPFSSEQIERFLITFGPDLGADDSYGTQGNADGGPDFNPYSKGEGGSKGKKKGHDFTPTEPE